MARAAALLEGLEQEWAAATVSCPFLNAVVDGSVTPQQFNRWLAQDYHYVRGFTSFAGSLLAAAPEHHQAVLLAGIGALAGELAWFKEKAAARGLGELDAVAVQPACQAYRQLLRELHSAPYAVQAAGFWAIELCYHQAWARVLQQGQAEEYTEFAHRWGNAEFGRYVEQLAGQADAALAEAPQHTQDAAALVARVAALEVGFWGMAYDAAAADGAA